MLLNTLVERLKRRSKDDLKGRPFEATLILQPVSWYLRYPLSYRDGTVNLMGCGRNDARDEAEDTNGYAVAATPVTSAQV